MFRAQIMAAMAGREAEIIIFGEHLIGDTSDCRCLATATGRAREYGAPRSSPAILESNVMPTSHRANYSGCWCFSARGETYRRAIRNLIDVPRRRYLADDFAA
jgi:hypothetical protein